MGVSIHNRRFQDGEYVWYTPSLHGGQKHIGVVVGYYRFRRENEEEYHIKPLFMSGLSRREEREIYKATDAEVLIYGLSR